MPVCYVLALSAASLLPAPDTIIAATPSQQLIKLGIHGFEYELVSLTYERQLSEQWSVLGSVGYYGYTYRGGTDFYDYTGLLLTDYYTRRERYYGASVQLRRYFRSRRFRPLTGWYVAANLQAMQQNSRAEYRQYSQQNYDFGRTSGQLQVLAGRQWPLGRRLTLDSYLSVSFRKRQSATLGGTQSVWIEGGLGLQVGYRFRPLPR
jgi:hypothetical protein